MTKKLLMFLLPLVFVFGCTKDFEDINKNPNSPIKVDPGYILANAQKKAIDVLRMNGLVVEPHSFALSTGHNATIRTKIVMHFVRLW
jgi:hypothetical protein